MNEWIEKRNEMRQINLLVEDGLGLTSESGLLAIVTTLT